MVVFFFMSMIIIFWITMTFFTIFLVFFSSFHFYLPPVIAASPLHFHAFIIPVLPAPVFFLPSCSLASFNHPLLRWESRLCSSTEDPESLLIIPQHVSHLHKHAAKNNRLPCQPTYTLEVKNISSNSQRCPSPCSDRSNWLCFLAMDWNSFNKWVHAAWSKQLKPFHGHR